MPKTPKPQNPGRNLKNNFKGKIVGLQTEQKYLEAMYNIILDII